MKISEIFYSIQGEAKGVGEPTVFVRLAKCNLNCTWCDTKYALGEEYNEVDTEDVVKGIKECECKNVTISGGEPLLQMGPLVYLVSLLYYGGYHITIETNGTIKPSLPLFVMVSQWNVSPKFSHIKYDVLKFIYEECNPHCIFKFVLERTEQIEEIKKIQDVLHFENGIIYLMPCASKREEYIAEAPKVIELCKKHDYNFSPREHIVLWDSNRGV